jgi:hypothetical protein
MRRPRRIDGIDPCRTHSYAVDREMPSAVTAWLTVIVAGFVVGMRFLR